MLSTRKFLLSIRAHGYQFDDVTEYAKYLYPGEVLIIPEK